MGFSKNPIDMAPLDHPRKRRRCDEHIDDNDEKLSVVPAKRVRFARPSTSLDGTVAEEVHESELCRSDLDKKSLWWSKTERSGITNKSRKMAKSFRRNNADQVEHYLTVFDHCTQSPSHSSSDYLEKATVGVPTHVRGLECSFVPSIKACRRKHMQEVIDTQAQLLRGRLPDDMRLRFFSMRAMRSSRPSRVMARLMGEGDAAA
jgi:hypothetical protein